MSGPVFVPDGLHESLRNILRHIGEDPDREGLKETPNRILKSHAELFAGYHQDPAALFKTFEDGACDEMVVLRNIEVVSTCEHHMMQFFGSAHVGYLPSGKIIGISKIARLVDVFARRLQVQERLTTQITSALMQYLQPKGAGCVIECSHSCMSCRGVMKQNSTMITSSLVGAFRDDPRTRSEFLQFIKG